MLRLFGTLLLSVSALACQSKPLQVYESEDILVRAESVERAAAIGQLAEQQARWVRESIPGTRDKRPEIWVVESIDSFPGFSNSEGAQGMHFKSPWRDCIYLQEDADPSSATHELVHFFLGRSWAFLPIFLEEGLCDWMAVRCPVSPDLKRQRDLRVLAAAALGGRLNLYFAGEPEPQSLTYKANLPDFSEVASHGPWSLLGESGTKRSTPYALGFVLIDRIHRTGGWEALVDTCEAARLEGGGDAPLEAWFAAGELPIDREAGARVLGDWLLEDLDEVEFEMLSVHLATMIRRELALEAELSAEDPAYEEWLRRKDPHVSRSRPDVLVRLLEIWEAE